MSLVRSILPILEWLPSYHRKWLRSDVLAGLAVAALAIPEAMAYGSMAGLPPEAGLYAMLLASLLYVVFGTSRQLSMGPTSALSILVAGGLGALVVDSPAEYAALAAMTAILTGIISVVAWILKLGFIVNLISKPVLAGFLTGVALVIGVHQLPYLLGIEGAEGNFFEQLWHIIQLLDDTNLPSLALGLGGIVLLVVALKRFPRVPGALIVVVLGIIIMSATDLADRGVHIVGDIPAGLPSFGIPDVSPSQVGELLPLALACFLMAYVEGMAMVRTFASKNRYKTDANQELLALGAANIAAGLGQGYPVGGGPDRTVVSDSSGAKTPLASGIVGLLIVLVLLFLTGVFANLPEPILAAIVLVAITGLFEIGELRRIYRINRLEFLIAMVALLGVLVFGILQGVLIAVFASIIYVLARAMHPHTAVLGRIPGTDHFGDVRRHPENELTPGVLVYRVESTIFFANATPIQNELTGNQRGNRNLILEAKEMGIEVEVGEY